MFFITGVPLQRRNAGLSILLHSTDQCTTLLEEASRFDMPLTTIDLPTVFADLAPIPQQDGPHAVCRIDYPPDFTLAYDYMRALWKADERSRRALDLTTLCLELNPANYTVWHFRRLCLEALNLRNDQTQIGVDLALAADLGGSNPKNYQIWYHRRALLEKLDNPKILRDYCHQELSYIASVIVKDGKNYHAWSHRQWILRTLNDDTAWTDEVLYTEYLIDEDLHNNSAWNGRWFAVHRGQKELLSVETDGPAQADYAIKIARLDPYNESPWRFLIAVLNEQRPQLSHDQFIELVESYLGRILEIQENVVEPSGKGPCPNLLSAQVDLLEWMSDDSSKTKALDYLEELKTHDPIRKRYWAMRQQQIQAL
jgi:protein farnesyltransferase/geranylgeranyltransferase type-1 subunit alpha